MGPRRFLNTWLFASVLALAACSPVTEAPCPTPTAETRLFMNEEDGYCFLYPAPYSTGVPHTIIINPAAGPGDTLGDAWMWIEMENAVGRTAAQVADAEIGSAGSGFNIGRFEVDIDGGPAVVVDGLPGPDAWRRVFVVHNERLYTLTFLPWVPNTAGAELSPLEGLYTIIVQTLRFPPPTKAIPTATLAWGPDHLPPPIVFEHPTDQQILDYEGDYWFKVNDIAGADGYLWSFSQNGVVVWENLRDEMGLTAGGGYAILAGSDAHSRFAPGPVEVSVRAQFGDFLSDPVVITIILVAP